MGLLSTILTPTTRSRETLILIQSTLATPTWLPLTRTIINAGPSNARIVCVCLLHPPETVLADEAGKATREAVRIVDWTGRVPGYAEDDEDEDADRHELLKEVCKAIEDGACVF
jgi:hypothetical protein